MNKGNKAKIVYFLIWTITVAAFWLGLGRDAMGYSLVAFYLVLPITGFVCPIFMASTNRSFKKAVVGSLLIGFAYSLAQYLTFSLANMVSISFTRINTFSIEAMLGGSLTAFIGYLIGRVRYR